MAKPCKVRPTIIGTSALVKPLSSAPTTITARLTISIRRLP